ncbi:flagellin [Moorella sp. E308F]|uniref:flagellin N-terminal helical domain-containing protein n=1 Tax=Moorella sp. E308F TaxID=2572682 RepID=UPI0010FFAF40|nr:flagellin [Moorella sp. E308F]GEA16631.1 flagellin [Moorella sp. E308F]
MRINQNISALNAYRNLTVTNNALTKSMEKLSSGLRINRAADDAAGLAISEKMRGQIRGLNQAVRNAQDGISLIQTAEGALNETHSILQRMRELAVQSANDTNTATDRWEIQKEINQLSEELTRIANTTEFNTKNLLGGNFNGTFQIGANQGQSITLQINGMTSEKLNTQNRAAALALDGGVTKLASATVASGFADGAYQLEVSIGTSGTYTFKLLDSEGTLKTSANVTGTASSVNLVVSGATLTIKASGGFSNAGIAEGTAKVYVVGKNKGISVITQENANDAITIINNAIEAVSAERAKLGAYQNRLEHTIANLSVAAENLTAAESRIRDLDMAQEMMAFTRNQILSQAGTAMLAQANAQPQTVLQLLR